MIAPAPGPPSLSDVYITGLGKFLPGPPVGNDEMEAYLGLINGQPSRARVRILKQNGILQRHYAIDREQRSQYRNSEMAAAAVNDALARAGRSLTDMQLLSAATTQGDLAVPGFASMVHGELGSGPCEIASLHGVCGSGAMALRNAYLGVRAGDRRTAVACASEFPSRLFKASRYEGQLGPEGSLPFDTEFLRWMLSDGAGAAVLERQPRARGLSAKIEWIEIASHAGHNSVCMYAGANKARDGTLGPGWLDYPSFEAAARAGAINLKQDIRLLDSVVQLGVAGFFDLIEKGRIDPHRLDWIVCHYSSHFFRGRIFELLERGGLRLPEERWFSNLYTKGNVGAASLYVLLEELFNGQQLRPGQQVFVMIPESGRFTVSYALLTIVGESVGETGGDGAKPATPREPVVVETAGPPALEIARHDVITERLVRRLAQVWVELEQRLHEVPVIKKLETGQFQVDDYKRLLVNMRQQVVEGGRWIARAASQVEIDAFPVRSLFIQHAGEEHRDFRMLERDYVSVGGELSEITSAEKNIGSEALSAWMFHRAGQSNPLDLLGAMYVIEGLGSQFARRWGNLIRDQLGLEERQVSFLLYHGSNDDRHLGRLEEVVGSGLIDDALADRIVKTAKVTARLYLLQLEEIDNR
jgi:3-oxoacyl-[acyl-carrier-protein] synthase-3